MGVHKPWTDERSKARDPYINLKTLARLSFSVDRPVREAATDNLSERLATKFNSEKFARPALVAALLKAPRIHADHIEYFEYRIKPAPTPNELNMLSASHNLRLVNLCVQNPATPRTTLLFIARRGPHKIENSRDVAALAYNAYNTMTRSNLKMRNLPEKDRWTPAELTMLAKSRFIEVQRSVLIDPDTPVPVLCDLLAGGLKLDGSDPEWIKIEAAKVWAQIEPQLSADQISQVTGGPNWPMIK
jgi:hypothetical protein